MEQKYQVNWLRQLEAIADKCENRPTRVTMRDLRDSIIYTYEILKELKETEEARR